MLHFPGQVPLGIFIVPCIICRLPFHGILLLFACMHDDSTGNNCIVKLYYIRKQGTRIFSYLQKNPKQEY